MLEAISRGAQMPKFYPIGHLLRCSGNHLMAPATARRCSSWRSVGYLGQ